MFHCLTVHELCVQFWIIMVTRNLSSHTTFSTTAAAASALLCYTVLNMFYSLPVDFSSVNLVCYSVQVSHWKKLSTGLFLLRSKLFLLPTTVTHLSLVWLSCLWCTLCWTWSISLKPRQLWSSFKGACILCHVSYTWCPLDTVSSSWHWNLTEWINTDLHSTSLPSIRQHPSYGDCLEVKREYY